MSSRTWAGALPAIPALVLLFCFFLFPVVRMLGFSIETGSFEWYAKALGEGLYLRVFWSTFEIALLVTLFCLLLGYPLGFLMATTTPGWATVGFIFVLLPLWTSVLVRTYAWMVLLGRSGVLNSTLIKTGLISEPLPLLYNLSGVLVGMVHVLLPFMVLPIYGAVRRVDPATVMDAIDLGYRVTVVTDAIVEGVDYDPKTKRVTGVRYVNTKDGTRGAATARLVFLNAGAFNSVHLLLNSRSEAMPTGLGNSSGVLGTQIMDHANTLSTIALFPQFNDRTTFGNRPTGAIIARYRNMDAMDGEGHTRGFSFQGGALQSNAGIGDGRCIGNLVESVEVFGGRGFMTLPREELRFDYRRSSLRGSGVMVVGATLGLAPRPAADIEAEMRRLLSLQGGDQEEWMDNLETLSRKVLGRD